MSFVLYVHRGPLYLSMSGHDIIKWIKTSSFILAYCNKNWMVGRLGNYVKCVHFQRLAGETCTWALSSFQIYFYK